MDKSDSHLSDLLAFANIIAYVATTKRNLATPHVLKPIKAFKLQSVLPQSGKKGIDSSNINNNNSATNPSDGSSASYVGVRGQNSLPHTVFRWLHYLILRGSSNSVLKTVAIRSEYSIMEHLRLNDSYEFHTKFVRTTRLMYRFEKLEIVISI
jgi:hypothetical protein